jgi:hypothetical protein
MKKTKEKSSKSGGRLWQGQGLKHTPPYAPTEIDYGHTVSVLGVDATLDLDPPMVIYSVPDRSYAAHLIDALKGVWKLHASKNHIIAFDPTDKEIEYPCKLVFFLGDKDPDNEYQFFVMPMEIVDYHMKAIPGRLLTTTMLLGAETGDSSCAEALLAWAANIPDMGELEELEEESSAGVCEFDPPMH